MLVTEDLSGLLVCLELAFCGGKISVMVRWCDV
jgi:hypothetical protein